MTYGPGDGEPGSERYNWQLQKTELEARVEELEERLHAYDQTTVGQLEARVQELEALCLRSIDAAEYAHFGQLTEDLRQALQGEQDA